MKAPRGWLALAAAAILVSEPASAQVAVARGAAVSSEAPTLEIAMSASEGRTTWWVGLSYGASVDERALILPVTAGAAVDEVDDAWFDALHLASDPLVCATAGACSPHEPARGCERIEHPIGPSRPAADVPAHQHLWSLAELLVWAHERSLSIDGAATTELARQEAAGAKFVVARFPARSGAMRTRTLRISWPKTRLESVPMLLSDAGVLDVPTTVWVFGAAVSLPASRPTLLVDPRSVRVTSWSPVRTDYRQRFAEVVASAGGDGWVFESSGPVHAPPQSPPGGAPEDPLPTLAEAYGRFVRASTDAGTSGACLGGADAVLEDDVPLGLVCPSAAFARGMPLPDDPCVAPEREDPRATSLRCGDHDDLALSLSGLSPRLARWTRWRGVLPAGSSYPSEPVRMADDGGSRSARIELTTSDCSDGGQTVHEASPSSASGMDAGSPPQPFDASRSPLTHDAPRLADTSATDSRDPSLGPWRGSSTAPIPSRPTRESTSYGSTSHQPTVHAGSSCNGSSSSSRGDSCSGSPRQERESSGGCGGGSTSDDDGYGDGYDDDAYDDAAGCDGGGDDEQTDSCSRDEDSYDDESCSNSPNADPDEDCSIGRRRRRRLPLSALTMSALVVAWPIRRRTRRRRSGPA